MYHLISGSTKQWQSLSCKVTTMRNHSQTRTAGPGSEADTTASTSKRYVYNQQQEQKKSGAIITLT
jgi:hypothetical protein